MKEIIIKPKKTLSINFKNLWFYRELFYFLAWRDIKVRYKQTAIGILWAILQPFLTMVIFSIFFGRIAGITSGEIPYPIFTYFGLLFWQYFSSSLTNASNSLVTNQSLVQKIYFPRLILPISATLVHLIDFFFAFLVLIGLMIYYQFTPTIIGILLLIPCLLITFLTFSGIGLILAAINVKYRDVRYVLPFFIQLLLFLTPVIYPVTILGKYQWLWFLNPMAAVIETIRTGFLGLTSINWQLLGVSSIISITIFIIGLIYFNKTEGKIVDLI